MWISIFCLCIASIVNTIRINELRKRNEELSEEILLLSEKLRAEIGMGRET